MDGWILVPDKGRATGYHRGCRASKKMPNKGCSVEQRPCTEASAEGRPEPKAGDKKTWKVAAATSGGRGQGRTTERKVRNLVRHCS